MNAVGIVLPTWALGAPGTDHRRPETDDVFATVSHKLRANTRTVLDEAARLQATPHQAGRRLAQDRVRRAMQSKGRLRAI